MVKYQRSVLYHPSQLGFTLIELIITIAVVAVIAGIAAPSVSAQLASQRSKQTAYELLNQLKMTKTDASIDRQNKSFTVANANISGASTITPAAPTTITFLPSGYVSRLSAAVAFKICDSRQTAASGYSVVVTPVGNITINSGVSCP